MKLKKMIKKICKVFWGCMPIGFFIVCLALTDVIQYITGDTLRNIPEIILTGFGFFSICVLILWINIKYDAFSKKKGQKRYKIAGVMLKLISGFTGVLVILLGLGVMIFMNQPEHVVERNHIKMVASVRSFLDEFVYYYEYKNVFFYGKQLGQEYYGNGGGDPLTRTPKPEPEWREFKDLEGNIIESSEKSTDGTQNEKFQKPQVKQLDIKVLSSKNNEPVFSIAIQDYIDVYNSYYWQKNKTDYLLPADEWRMEIKDSSVYSDYKNICYNFTEDSTKWSWPTISVYVPEDSDQILAVTMDFDDHGYTGAMYNLYEEMCFYSLKVFYPELEDQKIIQLYQQINDLAEAHMVSADQQENGNVLPYALYYKNGIGVYPYFIAGSRRHLCISPVTDEMITTYEKKGVQIYQIQ